MSKSDNYLSDAIDDSSNADADVDNNERANVTESDVDVDAAAESADAAADAAERAASWAATDCATNWVLLQKIFSHLSHGGLGKAAQVNKLWSREVEQRRQIYGVKNEFVINGRSRNGRGRPVNNSTSFFEILGKCGCVQILRLTNLRFLWPAELLTAGSAESVSRLLPVGLPRLFHLKMSKCAFPKGLENLLDVIASVAPNLQASVDFLRVNSPTLRR